MRLFVAVVPPPTVVDDASSAVAHVPSSERAQLRRIAPERLHLTLSFLGDVDEVLAVPRLLTCLDEVARTSPPMTLQFAGAGDFDGRVLWLGVRGDVGPLAMLAERVNHAARLAGLELRQKPHRPHLTVARPRGPVDVNDAVRSLASYEGPVWEATELVLMRSLLGPVPAYVRQAVWPLAALA
ncbi:MAG: 2-5 ligase [Microbacteriaceae bacterium]|nr:2-5 ligase [Microbacteriaceae bacterium]